MSEFLLIHYKPGHSSNLQYWAMGADQHASITLGHGNLHELKNLARGKKVSILIDAHYTSLASVTVPSKNRNKQMQAVPFAMEDSLAEDIDDTYFALGKSQDDQVPVIAIQRKLLEQTLATFQQQQIHVESLTADSVAIPGSEYQWCVLLDEDSALIKTGHSQAHCCDRENLAVILQALLTQANTQPDGITYYYKADDTEAELMLEPVDIKLDKQTYKNHALEIFVQNLKEIQDLNLLQGEFAPKRESNTWLKPWKSVAMLIGLWLVFELTHATLLANQLEEKNLQLTRQIEKEFKRAIPEARKMKNMKRQVKLRLKELKTGDSANNDNGFLQILSKVSPVLKNHEKLDIHAAVYKSNYIDLDLTAKKLQDIEQVRNQLNTIKGITTVLSTTVEKDGVKGRLRLEAKG